jgi:ABC-type transport system substrate-binding protein
MEAYEDYVPAGDHYEFQKGKVREITWVWRGEPQVMVAMVQTGEADIAWDVGVDSLDVLNTKQVKSGGSAEVWGLAIDSIFNPETSKPEVRLAMNHAINCQEMIDALYGGHSVCRGNIIWPGVLGATERNTAPYEYNPELARQLLAEADYNYDTVIRVWSRGTRIPKNVEVLEAFESYLEEVGFNVDLRILETQVWRDRRECRAGRAVADLLQERGRKVDATEATLEEMQAAMAAAKARGSASCATAELIDDAPSNETLDFGRQTVAYMSCTRGRSAFCDPSPGGVQEKIAPALAAEGAERQRLLEELADNFHDQALWLSPFDLPVIYAVNPKLVWEPRLDRRVRVNAMYFSE